MSELVTVASASGGGTVGVEDHCLQIRPVSDFEQAVADGNAFSWSALTADIDATDTVLGVQNDSTTMDLYIQTIMLATDASGQAVVHTSSAVTMAGTACTGLNLNRNSATVAPATAKSDETGNGQAAASYSGRLATVYCLANQNTTINVNGGIVLPYNHNIGIDLTAEMTGCTATIIGYFKERAGA
jgi:hypothetical protein